MPSTHLLSKCPQQPKLDQAKTRSLAFGVGGMASRSCAITCSLLRYASAGSWSQGHPKDSAEALRGVGVSGCKGVVRHP